ncbi:hypothetical protein ACFPRL_24025 [Pseudoclavibacter helvolus]
MPRRPGQTHDLQRLPLRAGRGGQLTNERVLERQELDGPFVVGSSSGSRSFR